MKEIKAINYSMKEAAHETQLVFEDGSMKYILICRSIIYVSDWPEAELGKLIAEDKIWPGVDYEAYDTVDGCDYYSNSDYAEYINCALLDITHRLL